MRYEILTIFIIGIIATSSLILNQSASAQIQIDPASIYYNDSGNYVPYKLIQNSSEITVLIKDNSYIFNKNTCSLSFYNNTSASGNPIIGSDAYSVLASQGNTGIWNPVSVINNAVCSTTVSEHNGTISILGTKSVSGAGTFSVNYTKTPFAPLKLTFKATNQNPSWTNYHIGLAEKIQVPKMITLGNQTYDLSQHNNTSLDRTWIVNHNSQLIHLTNNINFNMGLGWNNVNDVLIQYINNKAYLTIDYTYNTPILSPGNTITVDPTLDTSNSCGTDAGTTCTITVGNHPNRLLIFSTYVYNKDSASDPVSTVKIGGTTLSHLTSVRGQGSTHDMWNSVWYIANPSVGSNTVTVTWASTPTFSVLGVASLYNVDQTNPISLTSFNMTGGSATTNPVRINITPINSKSWIFATLGSDATLTNPSNTVLINQVDSGTVFRGLLQYNSAPIIGSSNGLKWDSAGGSATQGYAMIAFEVEQTHLPTPVISKVNTLNSTAINATWNKPTGTTWFWANFTLSGGATTHVNTTQTTLTLNNFTAGSKYTLSIVAANSTAKSASSLTKYNYTFNVAPTVPTLSSITSSQMRLGWTNPTGGANLTGGFNIYKVSGMGTNYTLLAQSSNNTNHYDPTSLQGNREYTFKIATRYAVGTNYTGASSNSTTVSAYTLPSVPTSLSASQTLPLKVNLSWTRPNDNGTVSGYKVERSLNNISWSVLTANTGNDTTQYTDVVSASGKYYYRISAIQYSGTSSPSNVLTVNIWANFLINIVKADNLTSGSGSIYQSNSSSSNNVFSAPLGSVTIPSLFNNQNFTFKDSSTLFVTGKSYNVNATSTNTLRMITNDFYVDCASDGTGTDFEWFTNGTTNHIIKSFSSPVCYTNNTVKWKVYWQANGNSIQNDTSTIRIQVLNNTFGINPTKVTANGTTVITSYAAPWIISNSFTVANGLTNAAIYFSANMALNPAYIPTNYTAGNLNVTGSNNNIQPIQISSNTVGSNTIVTFTYPTTYTLGVNANMLLENKTATFTGLPRTVVDAAHVSSSITFKNASNNDVIKIKAYDTKSNNNANYSLSMNSGSIPILTQIANFRNGTYGTHGQFGSIDLIVLIVLIFSMIGLNRVSETVGLIFNLVVIGGFSFYGILPFDKTIYAGIAMIALIIVGSTKKLPWS